MTAWLLLIAMRITDAHGFAGKPPAALVDAIATLSEAHPVAGDARTTAALLMVLAFRESSYRLDVMGDGGRAYGAFQIHQCAPYTCAALLRDARKQVDVALRILARSFAACPEYPLAIYSSGSCTNAAGRRISTARIAEARSLL